MNVFDHLFCLTYSGGTPIVTTNNQHPTEARFSWTKLK